MQIKEIKKDPIRNCVGAVSCGIYKDIPVLDLDYVEDSQAEVDANFVISDKGTIIEIQATAESYPFSEKKFFDLMSLAKKGIKDITDLQNELFK